MVNNMKIDYKTIRRDQKISGVCVECSKKKTRLIKEEQTVSPFNRGKEGVIKTEEEVIKSVIKGLEVRVTKFKTCGFICSSCRPYLGY